MRKRISFTGGREAARVIRPPKPASCLKMMVLFCTRSFGLPISPTRYTIRVKGLESPRASNAPRMEEVVHVPGGDARMGSAVRGGEGDPILEGELIEKSRDEDTVKKSGVFLRRCRTVCLPKDDT
ncbi:MAG: hypothetical protein Q8K00_17180, partial [Syntrophales bacterium]|nr:hypothetical protein [Syntrophales bacterium]